MKIRRLFSLADLAAVCMVPLAPSANALQLHFSVYYSRSGLTETFEVNPAIPGTLSETSEAVHLTSEDIDLNIKNDSLGYKILQVGDSVDYNYFATGHWDGDAYSPVIETYTFTPKPFYDGVSLFLQAYPGELVITSDGSTISITAVPEPSTWAMILAGFAFLAVFGKAGTNRQKRLATA